MKRRMILRVVAGILILIGTAVLPLQAASTEDYPRPPKPKKSYTIGVLISQMNNPHFVAMAYGYVDEAEKLGAKVIMYDAGGYQFLDKQISQMEDLMAQKVDAICFVAVNGPGTVPVVEQAIARGIPVINVNVMTDSNKVVSRIRSDDSVMGQMQADFLGQALKGKGKIVMLRGAAGTSWAEMRGNGFKKELHEKYPGIAIEGEQYSLSSPVQGMQLMEDFLQTFPEIDGVYNGTDTVGIGSAQAVQASGRKGIIITSMDFQMDMQRLIREGVVKASIVQSPVTMGRWGIRVAINTLEKRPVPSVLYSPLYLVTSQNVNTLDLSGIRAPEGWKPPVR